MKIIKLQKDNIKSALDLVWKVFEEFEAPEYSKQGIEEFRKFISYESIIKKFNKGELSFWGCACDGKLIGVIAARDINHICLLFVDKKYHRQGIARSLFKAFEEKCKNENSVTEITVNSSPYAVEVYHHLGFHDTDSEQTADGIRFNPMVYYIN